LQPSELTVDASNVTHQMRKFDMGCHSDSGYSHEPRNLYSQMIYGSSFESPFPVGSADGTGWRDASTGGGRATLDAAAPFNGQSSQQLSGVGAAVANRGLGNEGLVFVASSVYEGYLFAKSASGGAITVSIRDWSTSPSTPGRVLASAVLEVPAGNWSRLNFSLTPATGTNCEGIVPGGPVAVASNITCPINETYNPAGKMSDRKAHICVKCGGEFVVELERPSGGVVNIDFVFLQPGEWGRLAGQPVLKSGVQWLVDMGTTLFRLGGTFAGGSDYFWKLWRGKPWTRPSMSTAWGHDLMGGWGPFEVVDMATAAGIEPVITTFAVGVAPEEMADLVEYCWGNGSTKWGHIRIVTDGHPEPYRLKYIELGNEQYNPGFVAQVAAMESRASQVGVPVGTMHYLFPDNDGINATDAGPAAALGLGSQLVVDVHTSSTGGVNGFHQMLANNNTGGHGWGAINLETNCGDHTFNRALTEAADLNQFANEGSARLYGRSGSFCMERSGYQEAGANDQGMIFFLPNMTWGLPPFYAHKMISDTWQPQAVAVSSDAGPERCVEGHPENCEGRYSAQLSADATTLVVRYVNTGAAHTLAIRVKGFSAAPTSTLRVLQSDDLTAVNTPAEPTKVVFATSTVSTASLAALAVGKQSFIIVELTAL
jgi:alpha-L-arabinofuranosidase